MTSEILTNPIAQYTSLFESIDRQQPQWLKLLRDKAITNFQLQGFPSQKSERYRYMQVEPLFSNLYQKNLAAQNIQFNINEIFKCDIPQLGAHVVLLVNGFYHKENQINGTLPNGVYIGSLQHAITHKPQLVEKYLGNIATFDDALIALNTALFTDGIIVHVPENVELSKPIQIINLLLSDIPLEVHYRNLFILEPNSKANIVICDHTLTNKQFLTNGVTEVYLHKGACFDQTAMQNHHNQSDQINSTFIYQQENSQSAINAFTLHGGLVRNNLNIKLNGQYAQTFATGLFFTDHNQHADNHVFIQHAQPNCTSNQAFRGILDGTSTGAFNGRILVERDAQKTQAYQRNNNLVLSATAKMNTRPQLEIYADDVKCSHGATVGQLDQEALFYMQQRGIGSNEAKLLLMYAFANQIIAHISEIPLRDRIAEMVNKRLRGELTRCHNCDYKII